MINLYELILAVLQRHSDISAIMKELGNYLRRNAPADMSPSMAFKLMLQTLEVMVAENWVTGSFDPAKPKLKLAVPRSGEIIQIR